MAPGALSPKWRQVPRNRRRDIEQQQAWQQAQQEQVGLALASRVGASSLEAAEAAHGQAWLLPSQQLCVHGAIRCGWQHWCLRHIGLSACVTCMQ